MKFTTTRLKHLSLIFLPALIWLFTNATINIHTHILNNGIRISHAHPFEKNNTKPNQYPGHNHTKNELILLDLISHPLTLLTFAFVAFILSYRNNIFPFLSIVQHSIKEHYVVFNYHAPPTTWV